MMSFKIKVFVGSWTGDVNLIPDNVFKLSTIAQSPLLSQANLGTMGLNHRGRTLLIETNARQEKKMWICVLEMASF